MLLQMQKEGMDPLSLKKRVILKKGLQKFKDVFRDLSAQRVIGEHGPQSIQIEAIKAYLDIVGERRRDFRRLYLRLILDMDTVFMDYIRKKVSNK